MSLYDFFRKLNATLLYLIFFWVLAQTVLFSFHWDLRPKFRRIGKKRKENIATMRLRSGYDVDSEGRIMLAGIGSIDSTNEKWFYKEKLLDAGISNLT